METTENTSGKKTAGTQGEASENNATKKCKCRRRVWLWVLSALIVVGVIFVIVRHRAAVAERIEDSSYEFDLTDDLECRSYGGDYFVYNIHTNKILIDHLDQLLEGDDTLLVVKKDGNYGYLDRQSAKIVIPAKYRYAYNFSEGKAAVVIDAHRLCFIDKSGRQAIDQTYFFDCDYFYDYEEDYLFQGGQCVVKDSSLRMGIIDNKGSWLLEPRYATIERIDSSAYYIKDGDSLMVIDSEMRAVVPKQEAISAEHTERGDYIVHHKYTPSYQYSGDGRLVNKNVYYSVVSLNWTSAGDDEWSEEKHLTNNLRYSIYNGNEGLMDKSGRVLTEAFYSNIIAVNDNLFRAVIASTSQEVLLDSKGNVVKE